MGKLGDDFDWAIVNELPEGNIFTVASYEAYHEISCNPGLKPVVFNMFHI